MEIFTEDETAGSEVRIPRVDAEASGLHDMNVFDSFETNVLAMAAMNNGAALRHDEFIMCDNNIDFLYQAMCACADGTKG